MGKGPETLFKEKVLRSLGSMDRCWAEKIQQVSIRGTPDVMGCLNRMFFALELKASPTAKVDKLQLFKLQKIRDAGGFAEVVHPGNWEEILDGLYKIK